MIQLVKRGVAGRHSGHCASCSLTVTQMPHPPPPSRQPPPPPVCQRAVLGQRPDGELAFTCGSPRLCGPPGFFPVRRRRETAPLQISTKARRVIKVTSSILAARSPVPPSSRFLCPSSLSSFVALLARLGKFPELNRRLPVLLYARPHLGSPLAGPRRLITITFPFTRP